MVLPNMHRRIPSRVVEEEEGTDYFPSGELVRASTEEVGNGHEADLRRTASEHPSHAQYYGRPRSSSFHTSSNASSSAAENKV